MKKRFLVSGLIILFAVVLFGSCSQANGSTEVTSVTPNEYAILSYDTNYSTSGTVPKPGIVKVGDTITVAANTGTLAKTGWTFGGWSKNPDGSGTVYTPGMTVAMPTGSLTFYAIWQSYAYSIIFDCQGATTQAGYLEKTIKSPMTTPETLPTPPSKTGFAFGGWWTEANGGGTELTATTKVTSSMTVYAYWPTYYTIAFDSQDATVSATPAAKNVALTDTTIDSLPPAPSKTGYTFGGWWTQPNGGGTEFTATTVVTSRMTVYAKWNPIFYPVTYILNGGTNSALNPATYTIKTTDITFTDATRAGYIFNGWYTDNTFATKITGIPSQTTGAVTICARWTLEIFPITYELNGGINLYLNPSSYTTETASFQLGDPTRSGYNFSGWYSDSGFATKVTGITIGSIGNATFYAKWTPIIYPVTYVLNGGANSALNPATYTIKTTESTFAEATRSGCTFAGWYTDSSFSTKLTGIAPQMTGAVTIYAKWTLEVFTIMYALNGGTNHYLNPSSYTTETFSFLLGDPTRSGYDFKGWFSDSGFATKVTGITTGSTGNANFYAKWTPIIYPVTYVLNGGTNSALNPATYTIKTAESTFEDATRPGCTFAGWYTDSSFATKLTGILPQTTGAITIYAKWTLALFPITYELNGGINHYLNPSSYTTETASFLLGDPTRSGYDFKGWYSDSAFATKVTGITTGSIGSVTFCAKWIPIVYPVTYILNGGTNAAANPASYTIENNVSFADVTRANFTFAGWYTDINLTSKISGISPGSTGNLTLYAKWVPVDFSISYTLNGGINYYSNPASYNIETASFLFGDPTRSGYDFKGWYADSGFATKVAGITIGSKGNVTFYAKWTPTVYSIAYSLNGGVNAAANPSVYTIENNVIFNDATRTDYIFKGWYTDSNCTSKVSVISPGSIGNITVYAKWLHVPYPISYVLNGGTNSAANPSSYSEDDPAVNYASPSRTGFDFAGWYSDIGFSSKVTGISAGSNGNVTVFAKWTLTSYPINYMLNGGTNNGNNPSSYTIESSAIAFFDPSAAGYVFAGWYSDSSFANKITGIASGSNGIMTAYAKWYPKNGISVTVSIPGDGTVTFSNNSLTVVKGSSISISIVQMSYANYAWYLDLAPISGASGSSVSIATNGISAGIHELVIVVTDSKGKTSSASCRFSVTN